jgi:hypothetical protein
MRLNIKGLSQPGGRASPRAANRSASSVSQGAQSGLYWAMRITDREDAIPPGGGSGGRVAAARLPDYGGSLLGFCLKALSSWPLWPSFQIGLFLKALLPCLRFFSVFASARPSSGRSLCDLSVLLMVRGLSSYSTGKQSGLFAKVTGPGKLFLISVRVSVSLPSVRSMRCDNTSFFT